MSVSAPAQLQVTHDPLMNLMLSQPQIDVDSPVTPTSEFDPPAVAPGQETTYRVKINALEASIEWPQDIGATNLTLRAGGHGQILALGSGKLQPHTTFNYHVRATQPGVYTIPAFTVQIYGKPVTIPAAQLQVLPVAPAAPTPGLRLEIEATNLYVGQPVRVRILLPGLPGAPVQALGQVQINGQGFIVDQSSVRQQLGAVPRPGGTPAIGYIYETTLTPVASGILSAFAQGFVVGNRFIGGIIIPNGPGSTQDFTLVDSDPVELHVLPLPKEGQLPGFTGAFAPLVVDPPVLLTNVLRVGEPVKLMVRLRGDPGVNLARLVAPPPPQSRDWQVFAAPESMPPGLIQAQGFALFSYTLIPLTARARSTPAIPFSCFDPQRGTYLDLTIPPVPVEVLPGSLPADFGLILKANAADQAAEKEPVLSGLANAPGLGTASLVPVQRQLWFPMLQLAPAAAFFGLWGWDRRRRYLELHPDILLRRRARRHLRRQRRLLHSAARRGDAARFAEAAVAALQVACAPHYPARPQALVGADILALLPPEQRTGPAGEVVRRIFAVTDASRFSSAERTTTQLMALAPELDQLLDRLDQRLESPDDAVEQLAVP